MLCYKILVVNILFFLAGTGLPFCVVGAFDINTTANKVYIHNFPNTHMNQRNIEVGLFLPIFLYQVLLASLTDVMPRTQSSVLEV